MLNRWIVLLVLVLAPAVACAEPLPAVEGVAKQPLMVQVQRLREAMDYLGVPLSDNAKAKLEKAKAAEPDEAARLVQEALDPYCLASITINPESRVKVETGPARPALVRHGWRQFLVKVHNEAGVTAPLRATSPQAQAVHDAQAPGVPRSKNVTKQQAEDRWLDMRMYDGRPLSPKLSGLELEYRLVQMYSRDAGKRSAVIAFDVGQGTQDIGFRNDVTIHFVAAEAVPVTLRVHDENGKPTTAGFVVRDRLGRVYPSQAKRLAPDFAFHPQVYRRDGEKLHLPPGAYTVVVTRGPEYLSQRLQLSVGDEPAELAVKLARWVDPSLRGWWSGDHHIHAAGCSHYNSPTQGVHAPDMLRHCQGEDLKIGANLTWGPCFDYQKQFFTGKVHEISKYPYLLRYDVEVSGFGSHRSGHLCLLRLREQIPPGGDSKHHWPTLCLNTLKWAKKQGAVVGPAHTGWGLTVPGPDLPNYTVPAFNGIGACEYIADVTHMVEGPDGKPVPAVDFLSTVDTPATWELNIWYHTLNCGFRTRISGETDFPCIYGERVGLGRSYVKLDGKLTYDAWCRGVRAGRCYTGDGRSHLMDFRLNGTDAGGKKRTVHVGVDGSELRTAGPRTTVTLEAEVAALLPADPRGSMAKLPYHQKPYWHVERARIDKTRNIPVELIVNGHAVARKVIAADGTTRTVTFDDVAIERSSWITLRVKASSHTNPIWVIVDDKPVRASKRSARWCLDGVARCRAEKRKFIDADEVDDFNHAYDHAARVYKKILEESVDDTDQK